MDPPNNSMWIRELCPEDGNSTDCLLRSLLNLIDDHDKSQDGQFNWDLITFASTAPIGILATVLTMITVFQAFVVAGNARRKADSRAIGAWSQMTKKE